MKGGLEGGQLVRQCEYRLCRKRFEMIKKEKWELEKSKARLVSACCVNTVRAKEVVQLGPAGFIYYHLQASAINSTSYD